VVSPVGITHLSEIKTGGALVKRAARFSDRPRPKPVFTGTRYEVDRLRLRVCVVQIHFRPLSRFRALAENRVTQRSFTF
jgi:hypothetical protein